MMLRGGKSRIRELERVLKEVSVSVEDARGLLTLHLLKALFVDSGDLEMLFLQCLQAWDQWCSNLQILILCLIFEFILGAINRYIHLLDSCDYALGLLGHLILLSSDKSYLVV